MYKSKFSKYLLISFFIILNIDSYAQLSFEIEGFVNKKITSTLIEGKKVQLKSIEITSNGISKTKILYSDKEEVINFYNLKKITFEPSNTRQFWELEGIKSGVYDNLINNGLQYKMRKELEDEAIEYINTAKANNLLFSDNYLQSYLYSLIYKLHPDKLNDGRPGAINIHILKDINPNAFIFPNGTLIVTTGLLSTINSEEELMGVLAHEVAHFVLDHSIININKAKVRQKRAEFWAAFATGVAAAADIYTATKNPYYVPGGLTVGTGILAYGIAASIKERFGISYSREQELEADRSAVELMKFIKRNPKALSSALAKIKNYCIITGNYLALTGEGTHPKIDDRINIIGKPEKFEDPNYDKTISFINTYNSIIEYNNQHFSNCKMLADRNLTAKVATEDDYLMMALVTMNLYDTKEKNNEALELINAAKKLNVFPSINLYKTESIVLIRLKKYQEAKSSLENYKQVIEKEFLKSSTYLNPKDWSLHNDFLTSEFEWCVKMIHKVSNL
jgi:Zn-dependent protease with chaperone function